MKKIIIGIVIAVLVAVGGVVYLRSTKPDYSLPESAQPIKQFEYEDPDNKDDGYMAVMYNDRTYLPYGTLKNTIKKKDIANCIGYLNDDKNVRLFLLNGDEDQNYIMEVFTNGFMDQPVFYRAIDTRDRKTDSFTFIDSLNYDYWK